MKKFNILWIKAALIRAMKTFFQVFSSSIGVSATLGGIDWATVTSASVMAAMLSIIMSIAGLPEVKGEGKDWWKAALVRAVKTFFQTFGGVIGSCALLSEVAWLPALSTACVAMILSLATSVAGLPEVDIPEDPEDPNAPAV